MKDGAVDVGLGQDGSEAREDGECTSSGEVGEKEQLSVVAPQKKARTGSL